MAWIIKSFAKERLLILSIALSFSLISLMFVFSGTPFSGVSFSLLVFIWVLFFYAKYPDEILSKIVLIGFLLRSALAYFHRFVFSLPDSTSDAIGFERKAWEAASAWISGMDYTVSLTGSHYYPKIIAYIYYFLGRVPLVAQFLNVLLGTIVIYIVYKTILVLFKNIKAARIGAFITAIFPTLNLYSAILLRETFIVFFFALSFYFFSLWIKKGNIKYIILSVSAIFLSAIFHGALFLIGLAYLFFFCFYFPKEKRWRLFSKQLVVGIVITVIYSCLFFGFFGSNIPNIPRIAYTKIETGIANYKIEAELEKIEAPKITETLERSVFKRAVGKTSYLENVKADNFFDISWQTPIRAFYFYLAPSLKNIKSSLGLMGFIDILFYLFLFIFSIKTLKLIRKEDKALFIALILIFVVFSVVFAWGTSNYGAAVRHRQKIVFLLIVTSSYSFSLINWKRFLKIQSL